MAQPNVVREPSMDEILASIRRIIESNDPVPPGVATGMAEPEGFSGSAANDDMEDVPLTIDDTFAPHREAARPSMLDAFPMEFSDPASQSMAGEPQTTSPAQRSLSLADVAARVRAASERNPGLRDLAPRPVEDSVTPASSPLVTGRMAASSGAPHVERSPVDWSEQPSGIEQSVHHDEPPAAMAPEPEIMASRPAVAEAEPTSLISVDAGQQVARSFQDLAVAIDEAERRSHDDIAADLLRPMLQEWLDENLPTLVERLVREEIERVARGNRR